MLVKRYNPYSRTGTRLGVDVVNQLLNQLDEAKEESFLSAFVPVVNTREGEYAYHIELDLPGIKRKAEGEGGSYKKIIKKFPNRTVAYINLGMPTGL